MDVQEMHIEVNQATQAISANIRRKMYPEELDWILNKVMDRYIGTHVAALRGAPGAAESLLHLSRLGTILSDKNLPTYVTERGVAAAIPYTVAELLSVEPAVHNLCGANSVSLREDVILQYLHIVPSVALSSPYKDVTITIDGQIAFSMQQYATDRGVTFNGFTATDELWRLVPIILTELSAKGYEVYWQQYGPIYKPSTIIFASIPPAFIQITIDGATTSAQTSVSNLQTRYTNLPTTFRPGRLYFQTIYPVISAGAFSETYYRSPVCTLKNGTLEIELTSSFIVGNVKVHHARKPRRIDINLKQDCELPDNAHPDICDLATEYIKLLRSDPDWETKLKDNMLRSSI